MGKKDKKKKRRNGKVENINKLFNEEGVDNTNLKRNPKLNDEPLRKFKFNKKEDYEEHNEKIDGKNASMVSDNDSNKDSTKATSENSECMDCMEGVDNTSFKKSPKLNDEPLRKFKFNKKEDYEEHNEKIDGKNPSMVSDNDSHKDSTEVMEEDYNNIDFTEENVDSCNKIYDYDNSDEEIESKSISKALSSYSIFKMLCKRYKFKCLDEEIYVYRKKEGRYIQLNDNKLKVLIRAGWNEKIQEKLNRNTILEIIERLKTEPSIQIDESYFNPHMNLMNFKNGVLNVETGEFEDHSPKFKFTNCIKAKYKANAKNGDTFENFIDTVMQGNKEKKRHLQEVVGYILSEFYTAKKVPMIIGKPHSGKSTLNRIISSLIGNEHVSNVPLHRLHERFILAHLSTKKVNICSEISDEALANIEVFKAITGNDELVAEYKGKDHFTYKSKIKLLFSGNCMPVLKSQDITTAFFDRLTFINFNYTVPEQERDHNLEDKLLNKERSYIVSWAVEGLKRLISNNFVFSESEESIEFKKKYISDQNNINDFIQSNCILGHSFKIHLKDLYTQYLIYCHENCFTAYSRESFFAEISKYDVRKDKFRISGSNPLWGYKGIALNMVYKENIS